jgi:membrane fusion protein
VRCASLSASLFLPEAHSICSDRLGQVVSWSLPRAPLWAGGLICLLALVALNLAQLEYADKVSVEGVVKHSSPPAAVYSRDAGVVISVHVSERQMVSAGDALVLIDKRSHGPAGQPLMQLRIEQLASQQGALLDERDRFFEVREQQHRVLERRLSGLLAQQRTAVGLLDLLGQRVSLAASNRRKVRHLAAQDWLSDNDVSNSQGALLLARQARLEQQRTLQALQLESEELRATTRIQATETKHRLAAIAAELRQLEHEVTKVEAAMETLILAPIAGRVVDLEAHVGKYVVPGLALLTVAPQVAARHQVEVSLPSEAAGRVRAGMSVRLRYSGYPFQEYGAGSGRLTSVSEVNSEAGNQRSFRALVTVDELPEGIDHTPTGMSVSADIILASQPLWVWFAQPLYAAVARL